MANIIITEVVGKTYFKIDFGVYGGTNGTPLKKYFWADDILEIDNLDHKVIVELKETKADEWSVSFDAWDGSYIIDTVLGVTPTDNDHLATLLANLKG